jgi:hypothetical protein
MTTEIMEDMLSARPLPKPKPDTKPKAVKKKKAKKAPTKKKPAAKSKPKAKAKKKTARSARKRVLKAAKAKAKKPQVLGPGTTRLDIKLPKKHKAKVMAKAKAQRRTVTSVVLELIEKMK